MDDVATACPSCGTPNVAEGGYAAVAMGDTSDRANFGQRLLAVIIDSIIVAVVTGVIGAILGGGDVANLVGFLMGLGYYVYFEGSPSGQTLGKRAMGIRVVTEEGGPLGYGLATGRYFARILSGIPCLLGYFWMLWDDQKQTWHDKLVHSNVVLVSAHPVASWPG